jgi:sucrose phosphorylase
MTAMKLIRRKTFARMRQRLGRLYGTDRADELAERLYALVGRYGVAPLKAANHPLWNERDAILITYPDMVRAADASPLQALRVFCARHFEGSFNTIHLLPFFPASSDGGFSVIDYRQVEPAFGTWEDIRELAKQWHLMSDLVLNHCSRKSPMFRRYVQGVAPERDYFLEEDPATDLSKVVRPRVSPLLTQVETVGGPRHLWTTFSADQVDLNWRCPDVLFEFLDILLHYIAHGARVIRLDAVAFLWKERGTNCLHLPQTHEVVKLLHDFLMVVAPQVVLLTETNVPHPENISYFGNHDEAHAVYQFSLPPLLLHGLLRGDARALAAWLQAHGTPPHGCTFLNFTASHDGIGVRPLEGLLPDEELDWLVGLIRERGGLVSQRALADGRTRPYELNIAWRDALDLPGDPEGGLRRVLCSQAVALALRGIPAVWFHNMVGTRNWHQGAAAGHARDINRRRWQREELEAALADPAAGMGRILAAMNSLLRARRSLGAFHPDGTQEILCPAPELLGVGRGSPRDRQRVLCWFNLGDHPVELPPNHSAVFLGHPRWHDVLDKSFAGGIDAPGNLAPRQFRWLVPARPPKRRGPTVPR